MVRPLRPDDWDSVVALEQRCFPGMETWSKEQFDSQLAIFPEGQIGVEYQGKLVASSSSLILDFELYKDWHSFDEISDNGFIRNHTADGLDALRHRDHGRPGVPRLQAGGPPVRRAQAARPREEPDAHCRRRPHPRLCQARRRDDARASTSTRS